MAETINIVDTYKPHVSFILSLEDSNASFEAPYTINLSSPKTFDGVNYVPPNEVIRFTPILTNLPSNNSIIQYKWSFGDGIEKFIYDVEEFETKVATFSSGASTITVTSETTPTIGQEIFNSKIKPGVLITSVVAGEQANTYSVGISSATTGSATNENIIIGPAVSIYHIYSSALVPISGTNACLTATLTVIDKYYQHYRCYKPIYLKARA